MFLLLLLGIAMGVIFQSLLAREHRQPPWWMPQIAWRAYHYAAAVKTLGWDERGLSQFIETVYGIPLLSATTATGALMGSKLLSPRRREIRHFLRDMLHSPPRRNSESFAQEGESDGFVARKLEF